MVVANVRFSSDVNLLLTAPLCLNAELQNLLEAKRDELNLKTEELERSATHHIPSKCVGCAFVIFHCLPVN